MSEDTRKRYRCDCVCGKTFYACKSIFQEHFGKDDGGHGSCPQCNAFYNLTFDAENECMELTKWDDYIDKLKKEKNL